MRPVVHSVKHYVQTSLSTVLAGALLSVDVVRAVLPPDKDALNEVVEGAIVKAIYFEFWTRTQDVSPGSFVYIIEKMPGTAGNVSTANMAALGGYENKKNILYTTQALSNDQDADAINLIRGWVKIPKSKQRMGLDDRIRFTFFAQALDQTVCGFATYKEYT